MQLFASNTQEELLFMREIYRNEYRLQWVLHNVFDLLSQGMGCILPIGELWGSKKFLTRQIATSTRCEYCLEAVAIVRWEILYRPHSVRMFDFQPQLTSAPFSSDWSESWHWINSDLLKMTYQLSRTQNLVLNCDKLLILPHIIKSNTSCSYRPGVDYVFIYSFSYGNDERDRLDYLWHLIRQA